MNWRGRGATPSVTRQRLLVAAMSEVSERGMAGASLDAIAARAGLTKGAVYSTFGSRGDLLLAMVDELPHPDLQLTVPTPGAIDWDLLGRELAAVADQAPQQVLLLLELMAQAQRDSGIHARLAVRLTGAADAVAVVLAPLLDVTEAQARDVAVRLHAQLLGLWAMRALLGPEQVPEAAFRDVLRSMAGELETTT
jgi:AcrR family transcriptional regulator